MTISLEREHFGDVVSPDSAFVMPGVEVDFVPELVPATEAEIVVIPDVTSFTPDMDKDAGVLGFAEEDQYFAEDLQIYEDELLAEERAELSDNDPFVANISRDDALVTAMHSDGGKISAVGGMYNRGNGAHSSNVISGILNSNGHDTTLIEL